MILNIFMAESYLLALAHAIANMPARMLQQNGLQDPLLQRPNLSPHGSTAEDVHWSRLSAAMCTAWLGGCNDEGNAEIGMG